MRLACWLLACLPLAAPAAPLKLALGAGPEARLLQLDQRQVLSRGAVPAELQAPLGSLWKLFVYAYLVDNQQPEQPYMCKGENRDELYCCASGESIERDQALVQSCGLYFAPQRLQLVAQDWARYWQAHDAPAWLQDLTRLEPQHRVPVSELLSVLARLPAQQQAREVLLDVLLQPSQEKTLSVLGARMRVKTWSWLAEHDTRARQGGFAGWLVDGTPLWVGGSGTSQDVLQRYAEALEAALPNGPSMDEGRCVEVALFARYPVQAVLQRDTGQRAANGALRGSFEVQFVNGNRLSVDSSGELFLAVGASAPQLTARLAREEYVARVLDREASAQPAEAAKALAVAIRTYLLQSAERRGDCLAISDSSARQRVAPRPASAAAREVTAWTTDLVLAGSAVNYHADLPGSDRLSWQHAMEQAAAGMRYDSILLRAFPRASLTRWNKPHAACQPLVAAEAWLLAQQRTWRTRLDAEPGYSETRQFAVCQLLSGRPYVDRERRRIFVRGLYSLQDRLDLTHEYLHLAFEAHPNSQDEDYIEHLARHLLLE